jgi:type IV secretory pathway VirB3-like protein
MEYCLCFVLLNLKKIVSYCAMHGFCIVHCFLILCSFICLLMCATVLIIFYLFLSDRHSGNASILAVTSRIKLFDQSYFCCCN